MNANILKDDSEGESLLSTTISSTFPQQQAKNSEMQSWINSSVWKTCACVGSVYFSHQLPASILVLYASRVLHVSLSQSTLIFFVFYIATISATFLSGFVSNVGFDKILTMFLLFNTVGYAVCTFANDYSQFLVGVGIAGLAGAPSLGFGHIGMITPKNDPHILSYTGRVQITLVTSGLTGIQIGSLMFIYVSPTSPLYIAAIASGFCFIIMRLIFWGNYVEYKKKYETSLDSSDDEITNEYDESKFITIMWMKVILLCLMKILYDGMLGLILHYYVVVMARSFGTSIIIAIVQLVVSALCTIAVVLLVGQYLHRFVDYIDLLSWVGICYCFFAFMFLLFYMFGSTSMGWMLNIAFGAIFGIISPLVPAIMTDVASSDAIGFASALLAMSGNIGFCFGPMLWVSSGIDFFEFLFWVNCVGFLFVTLFRCL